MLDYQYDVHVTGKNKTNNSISKTRITYLTASTEIVRAPVIPLHISGTQNSSTLLLSNGLQPFVQLQEDTAETLDMFSPLLQLLVLLQSLIIEAAAYLNVADACIILS
jgi:hypothetical protein